MSNIIAFTAPTRRQYLAERIPALIDCFARQRRVQDDVFWLKENAEILNILECTGQSVPQAALEPLGHFYAGLADRIGFFPQYYRFLLSIGLDLEDLGMPGGQMEGLCDWASQRGLPDAELSDLQRAEARRLLARRGVRTTAADAGLDDRLRAFVQRTDTFALPNKKAAYELTHIVFYLSEYGRRDPMIGEAGRISLEFAGITAFLDQNVDLLAEICVALRQAGHRPNPLWVAAVRHGLASFEILEDNHAPLTDGYHEYLVSSWAMAVMNIDDPLAPVSSTRCTFARPATDSGALRGMSAALLGLADARSGSWSHMQDAIYAMLDDDAALTLSEAAAASPHFEAYFEGFARAGKTQSLARFG
ncbi:hypothetical protein [uncultured Tateyamaria sp.]|uniref:DUF6902 family protein n=1 Tax=uncultured Tateyamaria sp. TaxID=455651 RepID=UPI002624691A|nr:hypothetical protein [uncultured Tateyamaria sp.]